MAFPVHIYLSYHRNSTEDAYIKRLSDDLTAIGASVRLGDPDVWADTDVAPSDSIVRSMKDTLASHQWFVLVMTPAALRSPLIQAEVDIARSLSKRHSMLIILFVAVPCDEADIPPSWAALPRIDATKGYEAARDQLVAFLQISSSGLTQARIRFTCRNG